MLQSIKMSTSERIFPVWTQKRSGSSPTVAGSLPGAPQAHEVTFQEAATCVSLLDGFGGGAPEVCGGRVPRGHEAPPRV